MTLITRVFHPSGVYIIGDSQINDAEHKPITKDGNGKPVYTDKVVAIHKKGIVLGVAGSLGSGGVSQDGYVPFPNIEKIKLYLNSTELKTVEAFEHLRKRITSSGITITGDIIMFCSFFEGGVIRSLTFFKNGPDATIYAPARMEDVSLSSSARIAKFYELNIDYKDFSDKFYKSNLLDDVEFNFNCLQKCDWNGSPERHRPDVLYALLFLVMYRNGYSSLRALNDEQVTTLFKDYYKIITDVSWHVFEFQDPQLRTIGECAYIYKLEGGAIKMLHENPLYKSEDLPLFPIPNQ